MTVVDFGALPPEINSGRMYAGAGSGPLAAAAVAWEGLASQLGSAATSYRAVVSDLTAGPWVGPSSLSMAAAAAPYAAWMNTTATAAEQTASQLTSAIAAYEAAFAATVPPPVIAANRALLAALVATNIVGQNTPAIAATEAQYAEMWAQDAAAMYGYAGASAAATTLTPFSAPTQNTNPAGTGTQAAAVTQASATATGTAQSTLSQVVSTVPSTLQSLASGGSSQGLNLLNSPVITEIETLSTAVGGYTDSAIGTYFTAVGGLVIAEPMVLTGMGKAVAALAAPQAAAASAVSGVPEGGLGTLAGSYGSGMGGAGVSAGLGPAASVGGLSVPQSWTTASPAIRLAATALPAGALDGLPAAGAAGLPGWFGGMPPMMGGVVNAPRKSAAGAPSQSRLRVIPQMAAAPGDCGGMPDRWINAPAGDATMSERAELNGLRTAITELAKERDVLMRSAALLIKEAMTR